MKAAVAIVVGIILLWTINAGTRTDVPVDKSDPVLVRSYITFPCEALEIMYDYQYDEVQKLFQRLKVCTVIATNSPEDPFGHLKCFNIRLQWELMFSHAKSVERAWELMCTEEGQRRKPEYEIQFNSRRPHQ